MLNYGLAGRSQNVMFNLYLIYTKIEYKKINIFNSDPLLVLRPDLDSSQDLVKARQGIFQKKTKIDEVIEWGSSSQSKPGQLYSGTKFNKN
jgi:hypothetical protein